MFRSPACIFLPQFCDGDHILNIFQVHETISKGRGIQIVAFLIVQGTVVIAADQCRILNLIGIRKIAVVSCDIEEEAQEDSKGNDQGQGDLQWMPEKGPEIIVIDDLHDAGCQQGKQDHPQNSQGSAVLDRSKEQTNKEAGHDRSRDADH